MENAPEKKVVAILVKPTQAAAIRVFSYGVAATMPSAVASIVTTLSTNIKQTVKNK